MPDLLKWQERQLGTLTLPTVNARDLYEALGITRPSFPAWIKHQVKHAQLEEEADFVIRDRIGKTYAGKRIAPDYYLSCFAAAHVALASGGANAQDVERWCLAQAPVFAESAPEDTDTETPTEATRSRIMEAPDRQAISHFDPGPDEETQGIPRDRVDGWIKVYRWGKKIDIYNVETVRLFDDVTAKQIYPVPENGGPEYINLYPYRRLRPISEAEAIAWLRQHKLPLPSGHEPEVREDAGHVG